MELTADAGAATAPAGATAAAAGDLVGVPALATCRVKLVWEADAATAAEVRTARNDTIRACPLPRSSYDVGGCRMTCSWSLVKQDQLSSGTCNRNDDAWRCHPAKNPIILLKTALDA